MKKLSVGTVALIGVSLVLMAGCTSMVRPVSVLGDSGPFRPDSQNKDVMIYQNPHLKAVTYTKFLIDPVKVVSNESAGGRGIGPKEQALLADAFRQKLVDVLKDGYPLVDEAGPGVLRVRTAILDIQPAHVQLDEDKFLVLRLDTLLAHVSMELECVDAVSGERVVALIHTLSGRAYSEKDPSVRFSNIQDAFTVWTQSLRMRFDAAKKRSTSGGLDFGEHQSIEQEEGK